MIATEKSPAHRANGPFIASTCCVGLRLRRGPKRRQPTSRIPASLAGSVGFCDSSSMMMGRGGGLGQLEDPNYAALQIRTSGNTPSMTYGEQGIGRASEGPAILPAVVSHTVRAAIGSPARGRNVTTTRRSAEAGAAWPNAHRNMWPATYCVGPSICCRPHKSERSIDDHHEQTLWSSRQRTDPARASPRGGADGPY